MIMTAFDYPPGATPIDPEEAEGLLLSHITNRSELDRWEQENIKEAEEWAFRRKSKDLLSVSFILKLHEKMFETVWKWAGAFRKSGKNIGIDAWSIRPSLTGLLEDAKVWIECGVYPADEIAARFHHRMVFIHPFANGNGRHSRLMTDLLLFHALDRPRFTWGSSSITNAGECRTNYIKALRAADKDDFNLLLAFIRL
jgi:Fic-DOC domain mobile mystery protein B